MLISNKDYFVFFHIFSLYKIYTKSNNIYRIKDMSIIQGPISQPSLPLCKWRYHQCSRLLSSSSLLVFLIFHDDKSDKSNIILSLKEEEESSLSAS